MRRFILSAVNVQRSGVDRYLDAGWPIGVHGPILVVEAFQLQFQVVSIRRCQSVQVRESNYPDEQGSASEMKKNKHIFDEKMKLVFQLHGFLVSFYLHMIV